jgi:hypothetical protein
MECLIKYSTHGAFTYTHIRFTHIFVSSCKVFPSTSVAVGPLAVSFSICSADINSFQTAVTFIQHMDASSLTIDKAEFEQQLRAREREWDEGKATEMDPQTPTQADQSPAQIRVGC